MKFIYIFLFAIMAFCGNVFGQACTPDGTLSDTLLGVFPMPFHATLNPNGGITDSACVGHEYNFVFTSIIGDSFRLGSTVLPLDSMWLDKKTALSGLPKGLSYACNPPNCVFKKNTKGCVILTGKPEAGTEGKHLMKISGKLYANSSTFGLPLTFPDATIAPGEYAVIVAQSNEGPCQKLSVNRGVPGNEVHVFPNPTSNFIQIETQLSAQIHIYSAMGERAAAYFFQAGINNVDLENFAAGIWFVEVIDERSSQVFKIQKQ